MMFKCNCGHDIAKVASARAHEFIGIWCGNCRAKWSTFAEPGEDGQMKIWADYYLCTCNCNNLNIHPKRTRCNCEVVDLR